MSKTPSASPAALIARIVMAQNLAAHTSKIQSITANEVGGFNIGPLGAPNGHEVILAVGQTEGDRLEPAQLNQLLRITDSWPDFTKENTVQASFALGYNTAEFKFRKALSKLQKLADELMTEASVIDEDPAPDAALPPVEVIQTRLQKDGMPSFYITPSGVTCTHRTCEDDVPVWVKGSKDAMAAMSRIDKNVERKSKHTDDTKFVDLRQIVPVRLGGAE